MCVCLFKVLVIQFKSTFETSEIHAYWSSQVEEPQHFFCLSLCVRVEKSEREREREQYARNLVLYRCHHWCCCCFCCLYNVQASPDTFRLIKVVLHKFSPHFLQHRFNHFEWKIHWLVCSSTFNVSLAHSGTISFEYWTHFMFERALAGRPVRTFSFPTSIRHYSQLCMW